MYNTSIGDFYFLNPFTDDEKYYIGFLNHDSKDEEDDEEICINNILDIIDALCSEQYLYDEEESDKKENTNDPDIPEDKLPKSKMNFSEDVKKNGKIKLTKSEALYLLGLDEDEYEII